MTDAEILELTDLCSALADARLDEAERARLNRVLAGSEEARRFYVRFAGLGASLGQHAAEAQSEREPFEDERVTRGPAVWWRRWTPLAAAAALLLGATIFLLLREGEPEAESVAWLTAAQDAEWRGAPPQPGDELARGRRLELTRGAAEITLDSGASVVLQGPAAVDLRSGWEVALERGTLTANAPEDAAGFRVSSATVEVSSGGGEFAVTAGSDGAAEVVNLAGRTEATPFEKSRAPVTLRGREAKRFAREGVAEVRDLEKKTARLAAKAPLERKPRPLKFARWSFDAAERGALLAESRGFEAAGLTLGPGDLSTLLLPGRWQRALRLDGRAHANARGLERARTIAFWVKAPAGGASRAPVIAWQRGGQQLQIGWNRQAEAGALGALRTEFDGGAGSAEGAAIGRAPLCDGRWHHVAVMLTGAKKRPGLAQVKQYLDGRLDGTAVVRAPGKAALKRSVAGDALWLGRAPGDGAEIFSGEIDELFLGDRPLIPQEIRRLMNENQPPATAG